MPGFVWNFFQREKPDANKASCKTCRASLDCKNSTTGSLIRHLDSKHGIRKDNYTQFSISISIFL